jgi:hypothetical protein
LLPTPPILACASLDPEARQDCVELKYRQHGWRSDNGDHQAEQPNGNRETKADRFPSHGMHPDEAYSRLLINVYRFVAERGKLPQPPDRRLEAAVNPGARAGSAASAPDDALALTDKECKIHEGGLGLRL